MLRNQSGTLRSRQLGNLRRQCRPPTPPGRGKIQDATEARVRRERDDVTSLRKTEGRSGLEEP